MEKVKLNFISEKARTMAPTVSRISGQKKKKNQMLAVLLSFLTFLPLPTVATEVHIGQVPVGAPAPPVGSPPE